MDTNYEYGAFPARNPMATAAVVLGILSLMTCLFFYISIPCGAMAALLALLSHGREPMSGKSKVGFACGLCGAAFSLAVTASSVWMVLTNAQLRGYMESYIQYYLGEPDFDLERELTDILPFLSDVFGETDDAQESPSEDTVPGGSENDLSPDDRSEPEDGSYWPSRQLPGGEGVFI